ncbi:MAG: methyltransferase domain-containing protein [Desulfuromonadales bacterium]|nr:methyltransferase domain-containing protein [Desulfuromonadales bacterium]NIS39678.1 methyltransferase domain-containing protein [Desulfuromonadales bacterium]
MQFENFRDLMRLAHGFEMAKAFFTANDLDLFTCLGETGEVSERLAERLEVDERALALLLNALTAMGLIEKDGERYRNGAAAARYLVHGENYRGHIFKHIHHCWEAWNDLPEVVAEGHPAGVKEEKILGGQEEWTRTFIRGMDDVTRDLAPQVAPQVGFDGAGSLLDVGGGPGTYAAAFLDAVPSLQRVQLFDLPGALEVARERLSARGLLEKVELVEGDMHRDDLPSAVDAVWVSQVFHSQGEEGCRRIIDKAFRALNQGGTLAVHEFLLRDDKTGPLGPALFALHMLVMTQNGRAYSGAEIASWMAERGFSSVEVRQVSDDTGVVVGRKP